jgi:hypothetical protein
MGDWSDYATSNAAAGSMLHMSLLLSEMCVCVTYHHLTFPTVEPKVLHVE